MPYFQSGTTVEGDKVKIDPATPIFPPAWIGLYSYQSEAATLNFSQLVTLNAIGQAYTDQLREKIGAQYLRISWNLSSYQVTDFVLGAVFPTRALSVTGYQIANRLLWSDLGTFLAIIKFSKDVTFWRIGKSISPPTMPPFPPTPPPPTPPPPTPPPPTMPPFPPTPPQLEPEEPEEPEPSPEPTQKGTIPARILGRNSLIIRKLGILRNAVVPAGIHQKLHPLI